MTERRILLGVPSGGSPTAPFLEALAALSLPSGVARLERSIVFGNFIPAQREIILLDALEGDFDYLFFVDDDIVLPPSALQKLLETAERDPQTAVVGGLYFARDAVKPIVVDGWDPDDTTSAFIPAYSAQSTDPVDGIGFGCALLHVAAARDLVPPYFPAHVYIERKAHVARQCDEDFLYCGRVRSAGWRVRLDARVRCGHYDRARKISTPESWEPDSATAVPRMIVAEAECQRLVPLDRSAPRARERHQAAELVYITLD